MESVVNRQSDNGFATPTVTTRRRCVDVSRHDGGNKGWWNWRRDLAEYCPLGGRSSVGRAPVCGTGGRGFEPRRSPQVAGGGRRFVPYTAAAPPRRSDAPLAQRQSNGLLIRRFWVRNPGGAQRERSESLSDLPSVARTRRQGLRQDRRSLASGPPGRTRTTHAAPTSRSSPGSASTITRVPSARTIA